MATVVFKLLKVHSAVNQSINIAGNYNPALAILPLTTYGGPDILGQMQHSSSEDGCNIFFLPSGKPGGAFPDPTNPGEYNDLVNSCLHVLYHLPPQLCLLLRRSEWTYWT